MVLAMAAFATADVTIKLMSARLPPGQIIWISGLAGGLVFAIWALVEGERINWKALVSPASIIRTLGELMGTIGVVTALALVPLSVVSAIMQANPLLVTLMAALFLGSKVGLYRWLAILVGLIGVVLVIQPWGAGFTPASFWAVLCVIGLAIRDVATRAVSKELSTKVLSAVALFALVPAGLLLLTTPFSGPSVWLTKTEWLLMGLTIFVINIAYFSITAAMRVGEVGAVTPFRYSRILFALIFAVTIFDETLDSLMLIGVAIIVGSGLFTLIRERRSKARA